MVEMEIIDKITQNKSRILDSVKDRVADMDIYKKIPMPFGDLINLIAGDYLEILILTMMMSDFDLMNHKIDWIKNVVTNRMPNEDFDKSLYRFTVECHNAILQVTDIPEESLKETFDRCLSIVQGTKAETH